MARHALSFFLLCLTLMAWFGFAAAEVPVGRDLYYKALAEVRAGKLEKAEGILKYLSEELPSDPFADDALLELARMTEEELAQPRRAIKLYALLVKRYPASRLARRAQARGDFLKRHAAGKPDVYGQYQEIMKRGLRQDLTQIDVELRALLDKHPDFSLAPQGYLWLAGRWASAGQSARAKALYEGIIQDHPDAPAAATSLLALAELARGEGDIEAAEFAYARLARLGGETWRGAVEEGRRRLGQLGQRRLVMWLGLGSWALVVLGMCLALAWALRRGKLCLRHLRRPPLEGLFFLLLMSVFLWMTHGRANQAHEALWWLTGSSLLLMWPAGILFRGIRPNRLGMVFWCFSLLLGWAGAVVASVGLAGMSGQVLHTFVHGLG